MDLPPGTGFLAFGATASGFATAGAVSTAKAFLSFV